MPTVVSLPNLTNPIMENLLTGKTLITNECYKVATYSERRNQSRFLLLGLLEKIVATITILFNKNLVHQINQRELLNEYFFLC